ncbi:MAG TPA: sulfatase/phosphatase domain-containing protein, partial [Chloroflexota bacterium]|nr:sulfatase/phosphatase domain-containing protein [Chloroflexota bacterium]
DNPIVRRDVADLNVQVRLADDAVGRIRAALDRAGLAENTLFIYTTDHGIAFPGAKGTLRDPGLEVSLLARGPRGFAGGKRVRGLVSNLDLYPTILAVAGVQSPSDTQGVSLLPLVDGSAAAVRDAVYGELTYHTAYDPQRGIRTERYKYIRSFEERPESLPTHVDPSPTKDFLRDQGYFQRPRAAEQLYDLAADPGERNNLAADPAALPILLDLRARLERWMKQTGDPLLNGEIAPPEGATITPVESYEP